MVEKFLEKGVFKISNLNFGTNNQSQIFISFQNQSFTDIHNATIKIFCNNPKFIKTLTQVKYQNQYDDVDSIDEFQSDDKLGTLTFTVDDINKLEGFNLFLEFNKEGKAMIKNGIAFEI